MIPAEMSRIEKRIKLLASRDRVWRALVNADEFSKWFGVKIEGAFEPGARLRMLATKPGYEGMVVDVVIERMEPGKLLSWRWHPGAPDPAVEYSKEGTTVVEFRLEDSDRGTLLTVVETGFDRISLARRAGVYKDKDRGWEAQTKSLERYVGEYL